MEHGYTAGRRSSRATSLGATTLPTASYAYDVASGRMSSVSADGITATYRYNAATGWNEGVTYSGSSGLTSTQAMDNLGRLDAITWSVGSTTVSKHDYTLNAMNRRTKAERQDGSKWDYKYNDRGEVKSVAKADYADVPEPGKQFAFAFDGIGNRTDSTVSSLGDDLTLRSTGYTTNELNQYEEITHPSPGWLVLRGSANAEASVTIDGEPPDFTVGLRWFYEKSVVNSSGPVRRVAEITATRPTGGVNNGPVTTKRQGATFIPPPTEVPTYDLDGNQTADARWNYTWDGENRLILAEEKVIPVSVAAGVSMPTVTTRQKLEFSYDAQGRRLTKRVLTAEGTSTNFVLKQSVVFLYDGWNMIAEIDTTTSARLIRSYEWGLDVSGTMDGAGGVGGQLIQRHHLVSGIQQPASSFAPCYDGNGNVTELINLATGGVSARYEYGAFGETISVDGDAIADANPIRFSAKYLDTETGLLYYTHRYYDAVNGRWLNRDPIEEHSFRQFVMKRSRLLAPLLKRPPQGNLYGFIQNDPINNFDLLGLECLKNISVMFHNSYAIGAQSVFDTNG
ncbi:RHS repeat-associated core domain-containing protein [Prosthecobacter sp.]